MAVLADADERDVDRRRCDLVPHRLTDDLGILLAVEEVRRDDARGADQALVQVAAEAGAMRRRQIQVLVQVKQLHLPPGQLAPFDERRQELKLRRARGGDDARAPASGDAIGYDFGGDGGRHAAERRGIIEDVQLHASDLSSVRATGSSGTKEAGTHDQLQKADDSPCAGADQPLVRLLANAPPQSLPLEIGNDRFDAVHVHGTLPGPAREPRRAGPSPAMAFLPVRRISAWLTLEISVSSSSL